MGILLGLATALCWGSADLFARFATRKLGTFRTMLYMQVCGCLLLTLVMPQLGGWGHLADGSGWRPWAWGICAGGLNTISTLALYRSFEIGKMSIVAPLSASYPVLTLLLSVFTGERLTLVRLAGIILTIVGVLLVASGEKNSRRCKSVGRKSSSRQEKSGCGLGATFCNRIRRNVLVAWYSRGAGAGCGAFGLDHSRHKYLRNFACDPARTPIHGPAFEKRCALDIRSGPARY